MHLGQALGSIFAVTSMQVFKAAVRFPQGNRCSRLHKPRSLRLSPQGKCSSPLNMLVPSTKLTPVYPGASPGQSVLEGE